MAERKHYELVQAKALDGKGEYESIVSVFGNVDLVNDRVLPKAFEETLEQDGFPPIVYSHRWDIVPMGVTMDAKEVSGFELESGKKVDGLYIAGKLFVDEYEVARAAHAAMTTKGGDGRPALRQQSFAYDVAEANYVEEDSKLIRELVKIRPLYEVGPTIAGANPETGLAKSLLELGAHDARRLVGLPLNAPDTDLAVKMRRLLVAPAPEEKGAVPYKDTATVSEDTPWDADGERKRADFDDLRAMAAWIGPDPTQRSAYKFLHHRADAGHPAVWRGVRGSMSALLSGNVEIPSGDRKSVYEHLAKHYAQFDKSPPEFRAYDEAEHAELFGELVPLQQDVSRLLLEMPEYV